MGVYADLRQVKQMLNIPDTTTSQDDKLTRHIGEADNYANNQLALFTTTPVPNPDPNLVSLCSALAASLATYWNSQSKSPDLLDGIKYYEKRLANHIQAVYGRRNLDGLGENRWGKTSSGILGTEPDNAIQGGFADNYVD